MHYNTFWYCGPDLNVFATPDPIVLAGGLNLHGYTSNLFAWVDSGKYMSYEYTIKIEKLDSAQFMQRTKDALKAIDLLFFYDCGGELLIKDPSVASSWAYDVSVKEEDGRRFHVVLVGWSFLIYKVFKEALSALTYEISDDDECISLEKMFRIIN